MQQEITLSTTVAEKPVDSACQMLDLGLLSDAERTRALNAFQRLSAGDSLEIITRRHGGRLVAELQACYGPHFYCWPLECGPRVWRTMLTKPALGTAATVATMMAADQLRLLRLWAQLEQAVRLYRIDAIHRRSSELVLGLRRYVDIEDTVLFPLLEAQTRMSIAGTTERMRVEHHGIMQIVSQLESLCTTTDRALILQMFDRPIEPAILFQRHCRREEAEVYSIMDAVLDIDEERQLLSLLQTFEI